MTITKVIGTSTLLLFGMLGCTITSSGTPIPTPTVSSTESTLTWAEAWENGISSHQKGDFHEAILNYDKALELMPSEQQYLAIESGINVSIGEAYIMLEDGLSAFEATNEANRLLDEATPYEKQDISWKLMAGQVMVLQAASLIYAAPTHSEQQLHQIKELMEQARDLTGLAEAHYFLGIINLELGMQEQASEELSIFIKATDDLSAFTSRPIMRKRANMLLEEVGG